MISLILTLALVGLIVYLITRNLVFHIFDSKDDLQRWCEVCGSKIQYQKGEKTGVYKLRKREFKRQHRGCREAKS